MASMNVGEAAGWIMERGTKPLHEIPPPPPHCAHKEGVMRNDILKGQWKQLKGRVKQAWGDLTDDDLARTEGNWDQLVGKIEERTGQMRMDIENRLSDIVDQYNESTMNRPVTE